MKIEYVKPKENDPYDIMKGTQEIVNLLNEDEEFAGWLVELVEHKIVEEINDNKSLHYRNELLKRLYPKMYYTIFPPQCPRCHSNKTKYDWDSMVTTCKQCKHEWK